MAIINVQNTKITILNIEETDYISLTDMAGAKENDARAADIIKIAMVNVQKKLDEENLKSKIVLQVHDELVLESPENEVEKAKSILVEEMQNVAKLRVPLVAEAEVGDNWYEAH